MINRIIDVNLNRIMESLRIIEDISRFTLNWKKASLELKNFRHKAAGHFKTYNLIAFRDVKNDTAKFLNTADEFKRRDILEVIQANCKRLQESSRVLEEILKLTDIKGAGLFKKIRFYIYNLEKDIVTALQKKINLSLYVLLDTAYIPVNNIERIVNDVIRGGATIVQLKAENQNISSFLQIARKIKKITEKSNIPLIIYDRIDIAIASGADGVHIGKEGISPDIIRNGFFYTKIIGYSASDDKKVKEGIRYEVDYIGLEPDARTGTKKHTAKVSVLKKLYYKYNKNVPLVILGGISPDTIRSLVQEGIRNFAMTSAILTAENSKKITSQFKAVITRQGDMK